jgi:hypothetical protein
VLLFDLSVVGHYGIEIEGEFHGRLKILRQLGQGVLLVGYRLAHEIENELYAWIDFPGSSDEVAC